jgi:adenine-specific DNA-methyltransferase
MTCARNCSNWETTLRGAGVDADTNAKVLVLRKQLGTCASLEAMENEVFSLLTNFFKRYYQQGDFISLRRYKKDVYAIPYEGEEVKLHWANHDQYYIKTGEYFKQYRFSVPGGKWVNFELKEASTEQANNKAAVGKERRFRLCDEDFVQVEGDTLRIFFVYEALDKKTGQDELLKEAFERLAPVLPGAYQAELLRPMPTDKQRDRTLLHKRLKDYTARNTFDYFIHKDLGGFLRRELDFFIKNEVLLLDDLHLDDEHKYAAQLRTVKALKAAATPVIDFLQQLEDFQKRLWLKKKFVVESNWCITLDRVPKELYTEIAANTAQREEWKKLFHIQDIAGYAEPITVPFLEANPYLVLDTRFFAEAKKEGASVRDRIVASMEQLDAKTDGLLVHSENFQALQLLQGRYQRQVKSVYIDPPYNTGSDDFLYKDGYKESSWLALMRERIESSIAFMQDGATFSMSIDLKELDKAIAISDQVFGDDNRRANITIKRGSLTGAKVINPGPINLSENVVIYSAPNGEWQPPRALRAKEYDTRYGQVILNPEDTYDKWAFGTVLEQFAVSQGIRRPALKKALGDRYEPLLFEWVIANAKRVVRFASLDENSIGKGASEAKRLSLEQPDKMIHIGREGANDYYILNGSAMLFYKDRLAEIDGQLLPAEPISDIWDDVLPNDLHNEGGVELRKGKKPEKLVQRLFQGSSVDGDLVLDFFLGSGTATAVAQKMKRRWIGIEAGEYFDDKPLERMKNVLQGESSGISKATKWAGGGFFKYIRLESYEDVLNNLQVHKASAELFGNGKDGFAEDHLLHYALDVESRESLLNVRSFADPFNYRLRITRHNEIQEERIDLVETFNYLIGLVVHHRQWMSGFHVVTGALLSGEKVLIIWRNTTEKDNTALEAFFKKRQYNPRDTEFDLIYVNGDNTLENLRTEPEHWKVRLIEEEFLKRMWEGKDV